MCSQILTHTNIGDLRTVRIVESELLAGLECNLSLVPKFRNVTIVFLSERNEKKASAADGTELFSNPDLSSSPSFWMRRLLLRLLRTKKKLRVSTISDRVIMIDYELRCDLEVATTQLSLCDSTGVTA